MHTITITVKDTGTEVAAHSDDESSWTTVPTLHDAVVAVANMIEAAGVPVDIESSLEFDAKLIIYMGGTVID